MISGLEEGAAFAYSYDRNLLDIFQESIKAAGGACVSALSLTHPKVGVFVFTGVVWFGSVWASEHSPSSLIFTVNGYRDEFLPYYLGWVKTDGAQSDGTYFSKLPQQLASACVVHTQSGSYLDFYCLDINYCRQLESTGFYDREHSFSYDHITRSSQSRLMFDPCSVCYGVHRDECLLLPLETPQTYTLQRHDLELAKNYLDSAGSLNLEREDLARSVVDFVKKKGLLLVCLGSSRDCIMLKLSN